MAHVAAPNHELADEKNFDGGNGHSQLSTTGPRRSKLSLEFVAGVLTEEAHARGINRLPDLCSSLKNPQNKDKLPEPHQRPGDKQVCPNAAFRPQRSASPDPPSLEGLVSEPQRVTELRERQQDLLLHYEHKGASRLENIKRDCEGELQDLVTSTSKASFAWSHGSLRNASEELEDFNLQKPGSEGTVPLRPEPVVAAVDLRTPSERSTGVQYELEPSEYVAVRESEASRPQDEFKPLLPTMPDMDGEHRLQEQSSSRPSTPSSMTQSTEPEAAILDDLLAGQHRNPMPNTDGL
ncbi:hypothetical protein MTO96_022803 [Rhipicephalus appendiculatus]